MPPAAFACLTASLTPSYSHCPSELACPLCASTTAILIGPEPLPPDGPDDPGAPQPAADAAASTNTTTPAPTCPGFLALLIAAPDGGLICDLTKVEGPRRRVMQLRCHPDRGVRRAEPV